MAALGERRRAATSLVFLARWACRIAICSCIIVVFNPVILPITFLAATLGIEVSVPNAVLALVTVLVVKHSLRIRSMSSYTWLFADIAAVAQLSLSVDLEDDLRRPLIRPFVFLFFVILWLILGVKCSAVLLILFGFADYLIWKELIANTISLGAIELCILYLGVLCIWVALANAMLRNVKMVRNEY